VSVPGSFPQEVPTSPALGSVVLDDGSFTGAPLAAPQFGSNALLVGGKRSATGHPLFVAGPQVGYFFPEFFAEMELTGGGFDVRGAVFPGVPSCSSAAGRTSRGAQPRLRPTTSTCSWKPSATTTTTTSTEGSASR
jgi:hypothetical protein